MQAGFEPLIFRSRGGHLKHEASEAVAINGRRQNWLVIIIMILVMIIMILVMIIMILVMIIMMIR